jgi:hypothetical protein
VEYLLKVLEEYGLRPDQAEAKMTEFLTYSMMEREATSNGKR